MRRARLTWMNLLLVLGLVVVLNGCDDDDDPEGGGGETDPIALVRQGWSAFEALDYITAADRFQRAIDVSGTTPDAYSGAGWTAYSTADLDFARSRWEEGLGEDPESYDMRAGLGFLEYQESNYSAAVTLHESLLEDNASWSFVHIDGLDHEDIKVTLAMCYYLMGQFPDAMSKVQELNAVFTADVNTPEGVAELAAEIERLYDIVRG